MKKKEGLPLAAVQHVQRYTQLGVTCSLDAGSEKHYGIMDPWIE